MKRAEKIKIHRLFLNLLQQSKNGLAIASCRKVFFQTQRPNLLL
jgi:hypothetical protein